MSNRSEDTSRDTQICCPDDNVFDSGGGSSEDSTASALPDYYKVRSSDTTGDSRELQRHIDTTDESVLVHIPLRSDRAIETTRNSTQTVPLRPIHHKNPSRAGSIQPDVATFVDSKQKRAETIKYPTAAKSQGLQPDPTRKRIQGRKSAVRSRRQDSSKTRRRVPQEMQAQWRVGAAPSVALAMSREENQISKVISQATAFYISMFEVYWSPQVCENPFIFDLDNRVEIFRDSSVTAACLVAAKKPRLAREVLGRVLPSIDDMLRNPPPAFYLILAESALGLVKTPNDFFRDQVVQYVASRALAILGAEHPLTTLLTLQLPPTQKEELGDRLWKNVIPILEHSFGPDHYQSSTQVFCRARNMASCGQSDEAIRILERQIDRWSELYGGNSLIVCYSKIELANILVAAGSYMKAEFVVSDALRTSDMILAAELRNEDCHASEKRHRQSSIAFPRVAALRTLGRLHILRGNLGAASYYYSRAVAIGSPSLGKTSAVIELAQNDLDSTLALEVKQNLKNLSPSEIASLTSIIPSPVS